jgi:hypothetical protein
MQAGERREPSKGVVGLEPVVPAKNEWSAEGEYETLGMLYMPLNSISARFWVD